MQAGRPGAHHLTSIREHWCRLRAQAGLDDLRIHDLRHYLC